MILIKLAPCLKNITHNSQRKPLWNIPVFGGCKETNLGSWRWWCCYIKILSISHWKCYWPGEKEQYKGEKGTLGKIGRDGFPASVSRLDSQKNRGCEPPSSPPPYQSLRSLSPLLSVLFPSMDTGGRITSTADQIRLISCFTKVHKVSSIFQFSGVTCDAQEHQNSVGMPRGQFCTSGKRQKCISQRPAALYSRTR